MLGMKVICYASTAELDVYFDVGVICRSLWPHAYLPGGYSKWGDVTKGNVCIEMVHRHQSGQGTSEGGGYRSGDDITESQARTDGTATMQDEMDVDVPDVPDVHEDPIVPDVQEDPSVPDPSVPDVVSHDIIVPDVQDDPISSHAVSPDPIVPDAVHNDPIVSDAVHNDPIVPDDVAHVPVVLDVVSKDPVVPDVGIQKNSGDDGRDLNDPGPDGVEVIIHGKKRKSKASGLDRDRNLRKKSGSNKSDLSGSTVPHLEAKVKGLQLTASGEVIHILDDDEDVQDVTDLPHAWIAKGNRKPVVKTEGGGSSKAEGPEPMEDVKPGFVTSDVLLRYMEAQAEENRRRDEENRRRDEQFSMLMAFMKSGRSVPAPGDGRVHGNEEQRSNISTTTYGRPGVRYGFQLRTGIVHSDFMEFVQLRKCCVNSLRVICDCLLGICRARPLLRKTNCLTLQEM